jgi:hypothetical protein
LHMKAFELSAIAKFKYKNILDIFDTMIHIIS